MKTFKPMLAPNESVDLNSIKYQILASYKFDGIRCIFKNGEILSRSLKQIQNKQLRLKLEPLRKYSEDNDIILDGEIYSPDLTFQQITSFVMTQDFEDKKSIKKYGHIVQIPDHLKFYCFDYLDEGLFEDIYFDTRIKFVRDNMKQFGGIAVPIDHKLLNSKEEVENYFEEALTDGYEGLILRDPKGTYKFGRGTIREGLIYKLKPFVTIDAKVTGVVQSTIVDPNAEKTINELNRSVTSKKKNDRILIEKASAFNVEYKGKELKVVLAMNDEEKEEVWKNKDSYIGKMIEYKGMLIGAKDVPRHPVMIRFRRDKNGE